MNTHAEIACFSRNENVCSQLYGLGLLDLLCQLTNGNKLSTPQYILSLFTCMLFYYNFFFWGTRNDYCILSSDNLSGRSRWSIVSSLCFRLVWVCLESALTHSSKPFLDPRKSIGYWMMIRFCHNDDIKCHDGKSLLLPNHSVSISIKSTYIFIVHIVLARDVYFLAVCNSFFDYQFRCLCDFELWLDG